MHPILARPGRLVAYIAIWLPLGVLLAALLALQGVFAWTTAILVAVPLAVAYGFLCLSAWYVTGGSPVDRAGALRVGVSAVASSFMSSAVWLLIARGWLWVIGSFGRWPDVTAVFRLAAPTLFGFGFLLYLLAMAASYLAAAFNVSRDAERRGLELQVLAREAELRALRAQIDPHFLFNSLQSISALTTADPAAARRMCLLLADFLRETLALGARKRIPLPSELALARRFLAVEQVRFGERLQVEIDAPDDRERESCLVPPLRAAAAGRERRHGTASRTCSTAASCAFAWRSGWPRWWLPSIIPATRIGRPGAAPGSASGTSASGSQSLYGDEAMLRTEETDGRFTARVTMPDL